MGKSRCRSIHKSGPGAASRAVENRRFCSRGALRRLGAITETLVRSRRGRACSGMGLFDGGFRGCILAATWYVCIWERKKEKKAGKEIFILD